VARANCAGEALETCLFYDLTHARLPVGAAIVQAGLDRGPRRLP
jgi:hypothetical protein